jgi:hypothetical protein
MVISKWFAPLQHRHTMTHSYHTRLERGTVSQVEYYAMFYHASIMFDKDMPSGAYLACVALLLTGLLLSEG